MWFVFERSVADIHDSLGFFRAGDSDEYLDRLDGFVGDRYHHEFQLWNRDLAVGGRATE